MNTTIQVSKELLEELKKRKINKEESYENLIWSLIEDRMKLSEETKKNIKISEKQIKEGKTTSFEQVKKELGINV